MGDTVQGGRGVQGIVYMPGGRGRPAETLGILTPRTGETPQAAFARQFGNVRGAQVFSYQPERGGRLRSGEVDIQDLNLSSRQLRAGSFPATAAGFRSAGEQFVQTGRRTNQERRSAQAAGRESVLQRANALRQRVLRATRGQSPRRRQAALRREGLPSSALRAPLTVANVNRGRIVG